MRPSPDTSSFVLHCMNVWSYDVAISADISLCTVPDWLWTNPHAHTLHLRDSHTVIYICRCDLHIPQLAGINFNMFNLMVAIDAHGRGGWSECVSTYWLPCSHVLVTGGLIGSRLVIFHSNRKQMKCLCYMQCCWLVTIREELWPSPLFLLYINVISYIFFCPSSSS